MKHIFLFGAIIATALVQKGFAQDNTKTTSSQLLNTYYQLKDNLVAGDPTPAAKSAGELVKVINITDKQLLEDNTRTAFLKDAEAISKSGDIRIQREKFATLSNSMFELAKTVKFSPDPVYQQYCPMKKASWLSNDKAIKNPYYGSAMLTCGTIKTTL